MKNRHLVILTMLFLSCLLAGCRPGSSTEASNHPDVISCQYMGPGDRNGETIVNLVFKNNTGKNLNTVYGGLRILDAHGNVIQRTGFTYSRPFSKGEEKQIPAFTYVPLTEASKNVLQQAGDFIPIQFNLDEVHYSDGESDIFNE